MKKTIKNSFYVQVLQTVTEFFFSFTASTVTAHYITLGLTYMNNGEGDKAQEARYKILQTQILIQQELELLEINNKAEILRQ